MFIINFENDFIDIILKNFQYLGVDYWDPLFPKESGDRAYKRYVKIHQRDNRLGALLRQFINLGIKFLPTRNWNVRISSALKNYKKMPYADELDFFIKQASSGQEIIGFQSKRSLCTYDEDALLNCWSIHHVHLSQDLEENGVFYKRSDWLLMLHQTKDTLYLIDVLPHKDFEEDPRINANVNLSFSRKKVFEQLVRDFPETMEKWRLKGVRPSKQDVNDFDIRSLRKNGIQLSVEVDGKVYLGGYGIATSSSGMQATMEADNYNRMLRSWKSEIESSWKLIFERIGLKPNVIEPALFRLIRNERGLVVIEQNSNTVFIGLSEKRYFGTQKLVEM